MPAILKLDTRSTGAARGMRSGRSMEDRLLYETDQAFVELLLPRAQAGTDEVEFIVGHVVPRQGIGHVDLSTYRLSIEEGGGLAHNVWADEGGEFVIPVSAGASFRVQCIPPIGPPSLLVYQSHSPR